MHELFKWQCYKSFVTMKSIETHSRNNLRSRFSIYSVLKQFILGSKISTVLFFYILSVLFLSHGKASANSLEEVEDKELQKLLNQEQYVAVLFSKFV